MKAQGQGRLADTMGYARTVMGRAAAGVAVLALAAGAAAQTNPVQWSAAAPAGTVRPGGTVTVEVTAQMDAGWHIYALAQPRPPIATTITVPAGQPFALAGEIGAPTPRSAFDQSFDI